MFFKNGRDKENLALHAHLVRNVVVRELDFLKPIPEELSWHNGNWSLICGSDVVYTPEIASGLARTLKSLFGSEDGAFCILLHTLRRYDDVDSLFFDALRDGGMRVEEIREDHSIGPAPYAEEHELFPDQRIAVLRISLIK